MRASLMSAATKAGLFGIPLAMDAIQPEIATQDDFEEWLLAVLALRRAEIARGALETCGTHGSESRGKTWKREG